MAASVLVTNMMNFVQAALVAKGAPAMYPPDLEFIMVQALTELSTDALVSGADQAVFATHVAQTVGDAAP